jgi:hypothetical protein
MRVHRRLQHARPPICFIFFFRTSQTRTTASIPKHKKDIQEIKAKNIAGRTLGQKEKLASKKKRNARFGGPLQR